MREGMGTVMFPTVVSLPTYGIPNSPDANLPTSSTPHRYVVLPLIDLGPIMLDDAI